MCAPDDDLKAMCVEKFNGGAVQTPDWLLTNPDESPTRPRGRRTAHNAAGEGIDRSLSGCSSPAPTTMLARQHTADGVFPGHRWARRAGANGFVALCPDSAPTFRHGGPLARIHLNAVRLGKAPCKHYASVMQALRKHVASTTDRVKRLKVAVFKRLSITKRARTAAECASAGG